MLPEFTRNVYCLLGLPFDAMDLEGAEQRIRAAAADRVPCFLSTANLNFLVACQSDVGFRDSILHSDLCVTDGMPLVWIARLLGLPFRERVAGSTLFHALRHGSGKRLSVFFFGGREGVAQAACRRLVAEDLGLTCVGSMSPGFGSIEEMSSDAIIEVINASNADFLVVALGARKGQAWIEHNRHRLHAPVISHLGAVVNFIGGTIEQAPGWMQKAGLEWLWRIKEEPSLWRRYFWDGLALLRLLSNRVLPYAWYLRRNGVNAAQLAESRAEVIEEDESCAIRLHGPWTQENLAPVRDCFSRAALACKNVTLDLAGATYVDSAFIGLVLLLRGYLGQRGRALVVAQVRDPVRRVFRYCCAEYLCSTAP